VALVRKGTILTERPQLVGEGSGKLLQIQGATWSARRIPYGRNIGFKKSNYFNIYFKMFMSEFFVQLPQSLAGKKDS
jgi:hypothetical protein